MQVVQHKAGGKAQNGKTGGAQESVATLVTRGAVADIMSVAIDLDGHATFQTGEIEDYAAYRVLAAEFETAGSLA